MYLCLLDGTYLESNGSPKQLMLCVAERILFMLACTYLKPTPTSGSIFKKEADTRIETTFSGCKEGYTSCEDVSPWSLSWSLSSLSLLLFMRSCAWSLRKITICVNSHFSIGKLFQPSKYIMTVALPSFPSSSELKNESLLSWCFIHAINQSKIVMSQWTDMSTSSRLCPVVMSRKYPIWLRSKSCRQTKSFLESLVSSHTWIVTLRLKI